MKIAIIGFATEGRVSAEYWARQGQEVTVCDQDESLAVPSEFERQLGKQYLDDLARFDVIVRSAGIHPDIILADNPTVRPKITTAVNEFLAHCPTKNTIGITGTKGKGTTSTLVTKMLEAAGKTVWLGGNIGRSPLEFIDQIRPDDWVVLELSSFQLSDIKHSTHIATCLMVVPEHLNWHDDVDDYIDAKTQLFIHQSEYDTAIYYAQNEISEDVACASIGTCLPYYEAPGAYINNHAVTIDSQEICKVNEVGLLGEFNLQNVCAAVTTVWAAGNHDTQALRSVIAEFKGLEHHLEFVRELGGVSYYDDSFATIPEATIEAIRAFKQPKVVILGGSDKGAAYDILAEAVAKNNVRHAVLIGDQAKRIQTALEHVGFSDYSLGGNTMPAIVKEAQHVAKSGDIVLLSTACASFGLFQDYKDRGNQFKSVVLGL